MKRQHAKSGAMLAPMLIEPYQIKYFCDNNELTVLPGIDSANDRRAPVSGRAYHERVRDTVADGAAWCQK